MESLEHRYKQLEKRVEFLERILKKQIDENVTLQNQHTEFLKFKQNIMSELNFSSEYDFKEFMNQSIPHFEYTTSLLQKRPDDFYVKIPKGEREYDVARDFWFLEYREQKLFKKQYRPLLAKKFEMNEGDLEFILDLREDDEPSYSLEWGSELCEKIQQHPFPFGLYNKVLFEDDEYKKLYEQCKIYGTTKRWSSIVEDLQNQKDTTKKSSCNCILCDQ